MTQTRRALAFIDRLKALQGEDAIPPLVSVLLSVTASDLSKQSIAEPDQGQVKAIETTSQASKWPWVRRFAERLVDRRPEISLTTASALGLIAFNPERNLHPEDEADKYKTLDPNASDGSL